MDELCESLSVILGNSDGIQHYSATTTGYLVRYLTRHTGTKTPIGN